MGELIKYELPNGLNKLEESIVLASKGVRVFHMEEKDFKNFITTSITMALFDLGQSMQTQDRQLLESRLREDLKKYFGKYTSEEIKKAIEMGVRGEFKTKPEDVIFISVRGINDWIKKYGTQTKIEAMKKVRILEEKMEKEKGELDKENRIKEANEIATQDLILAFASFKDGGGIYDPLNVLYDHLDRKGLVRLSNQRKTEIYNQAFERFKIKYSQGSSIAEYVENKKVQKEIEGGSSRIQALVKVSAKQMALTVIFKDLIELGLTMEEYLNDQDQ